MIFINILTYPIYLISTVVTNGGTAHNDFTTRILKDRKARGWPWRIMDWWSSLGIQKQCSMVMLVLPRDQLEIYSHGKKMFFSMWFRWKTMKQTALYVAILTEACCVSQTDSSFILHPKLTLDFQYSCFCLAC